MSFNYRYNGQWYQPTVKRRENGQWSTVSTGGGGGGGGGTIAGFDWRNPPTRSTTVQHTSIGGTIQNALNSISSDTELVLDNGPYTEHFSLPSTDSITISGVGDGTTINMPTDTTRDIISAPHTSLSTARAATTSASTIARGDTTVPVSDSSIFSVGDDILLYDPNSNHEGISDAGTSGSDSGVGEYNVVASTSAGSITLERPALENYASASFEVSVFDWGVQDVHIDNIDLQGFDPTTTDSNNGVHLYYVKNVWLSNFTGDSLRRASGSFFYCKNVSIRNGVTTNPGNYCYRPHSCNHVRAENLYGTGARHVINVGRSGDWAPSYDYYFYNCSGANSSDLHDAHWGVRDIWFEAGPDTLNSQMSFSRPRGADIHSRSAGGQNMTYNCGGHDAYVYSQKPLRCTSENMHIDNVNNLAYIRPYNDLTVEDCRMEDVRATNVTGSWGTFLTSAGTIAECNIDNFMVYNVSINGSWVDMNHISSISGYDSTAMTFDVQFPSDQTPSEYFA